MENCWINVEKKFRVLFIWIWITSTKGLLPNNIDYMQNFFCICTVKADMNYPVIIVLDHSDFLWTSYPISKVAIMNITNL